MDIPDNIDPPGLEMNPEQQAVADSLSPEVIQAIDDELLSHAANMNRKAARLVMSTMNNPSLKIAGLPDLFYGQRVKDLVRRGLLVADGDPSHMQYSEVRLP